MKIEKIILLISIGSLIYDTLQYFKIEPSDFIRVSIFLRGTKIQLPLYLFLLQEILLASILIFLMMEHKKKRRRIHKKDDIISRIFTINL